jgi:hypothetical protein
MIISGTSNKDRGSITAEVRYPKSGFLEGSGMASKSSTVKIGPAIDAALYKEFVQVAKQNGQSQRYLLEKAIEHYIRNVVPSQQLVRPEVMEAYQRSNEKFRELYAKLAK